MQKPRILIVDDEINTLEGMVRVLQGDGYDVTGASSGEEALSRLSQDEHDIVVSDVRMPGLDGLSLLDAIARQGLDTAVVLLTGHGSIQDAVEAMKRGAQDYLEKPLNVQKLQILCDRILESRRMERENRLMQRELEDRYSFSRMVGRSPAMKRVFEIIKDVAPSTASVLITGETGTGKELVARAIHYNSDRSDRPFVPLHCASLSEGLLESELFGHEKGAFTGSVRTHRGRFELADRGTLFLDEVGEMGLSLQVKLLRILERGVFERVGGEKSLKIDTRLICATHRSLEQEVGRGRFREDLYYRLNVIQVRLPPLRERGDDVLLLANHFLKDYAEQNGKEIEGFSVPALELLGAYSWPGNVRELENAVERAVVLCKGPQVGPDLLPRAVLGGGRSTREGMISVPIGVTLREAEKEIILRTVESTQGNKTRAARLLGISTRKIEYRYKEWGLTRGSSEQ